jgi:hypothetical protein
LLALMRNSVVVERSAYALFAAAHEQIEVTAVSIERFPLVASRSWPSVTFVLDGRSLTHESLVVRIAEYRRVAPMNPILVVLTLGTEAAIRTTSVLDAGACDILDSEIGTSPPFLLDRIRSTHAAPMKRLLQRRIHLDSAGGWTLLQWMADAIVDRLGVGDLAVALECNERSLSVWCSTQGLPLPRRVFAWQRLILALAMTDSSVRPIANAAEGAGLTPFSLRRAVTRMLGPVTSMRHGALDLALRTFQAEIASTHQSFSTSSRGIT